LASGTPGLSIGVAGPEGVRFARSYGVADLEHRAPVTADTVFQIASVTKQFTAAAALLTVEDGRMSLDDKLSRFVPEFARAERVTLRQLLIQTSGIANYAEDPSASPFKSVARTPEEMAAVIARLKPGFVFEPGASWAYSNSNYQLLGCCQSNRNSSPPDAVGQGRRCSRPQGTATRPARRSGSACMSVGW
jgi:CubicO group peptidase (beta-lactamase class C family)